MSLGEMPLKPMAATRTIAVAAIVCCYLSDYIIDIWIIMLIFASPIRENGFATQLPFRLVVGVLGLLSKNFFKYKFL